jgi:hypothetical protein
MLKKSAKSAIVMAGVASLFALITFLFLELLRNSSMTNVFAKAQLASSGDVLAFIFIAIAIILILIVLPGAFIIRNWSDVHFGKEGLIRWTVFGILYGCLAQVSLVLIPSHNSDRSFTSFAIEKGTSLGLGLVLFSISYFLAFKLLKRKI